MRTNCTQLPATDQLRIHYFNTMTVFKVCMRSDKIFDSSTKDIFTLVKSCTRG